MDRVQYYWKAGPLHSAVVFPGDIAERSMRTSARRRATYSSWAMAPNSFDDHLSISTEQAVAPHVFRISSHHNTSLVDQTPDASPRHLRTFSPSPLTTDADGAVEKPPHPPRGPMPEHYRYRTAHSVVLTRILAPSRSYHSWGASVTQSSIRPMQCNGAVGHKLDSTRLVHLSAWASSRVRVRFLGPTKSSVCGFGSGSGEVRLRRVCSWLLAQYHWWLLLLSPADFVSLCCIAGRLHFGVPAQPRRSWQSALTLARVNAPYSPCL
ncbi:hypothetical protein OH77DRAFT_892753 [Trametes cingulata]|nr:hypothetical protein OH77DRAFT_892753 [Trametes cingulata]